MAPAQNMRMPNRPLRPSKFACSMFCGSSLIGSLRQGREERLNDKPQNAEHANVEPSPLTFEIRLFEILWFIIPRLPMTEQGRKAKSHNRRTPNCLS